LALLFNELLRKQAFPTTALLLDAMAFVFFFLKLQRES
jgi:hypothetical protein